MNDADEIAKVLNLQPHPEGGWFRESFRDSASTAIYYLLKAGEVSRWHRIDAAEVWHFYRGAPLELKIGKAMHVLGPAIEQGEAPQAVVPPGEWQTARSLGDYTLVGCTVAPGFAFSSFEMAPEGFDNARDSMPIEVVGSRRFLKIDQTANLRAGSKVSKIWEHGFEYRSLDNRLCD